MKEVPYSYVTINRWGIVILAALAIIVQNPFIATILLIIQAVGLFFGIKANLFIQLVKPFLTKATSGARTEAVELLRFNNIIGVCLLTLSVISFIFGLNLAGYIFVGMVGVAAFIAICGFCIGCTMYYQYKKRIQN